ncbi:MAG: hypothetical protein EOO24_36260 [Comamonadaceae bacterium]|nr:MAG: hypothetical protein EOO24_36260 [Comamonadaceae bacterium]
MNLRNIAVTVRELPGNQYRWALLEGTGEQGKFVSYALLKESNRSYDKYSTALAAGIAGLRLVFGADGPRHGGSWEPETLPQELL